MKPCPVDPKRCSHLTTGFFKNCDECTEKAVNDLRVEQGLKRVQWYRYHGETQEDALDKTRHWNEGGQPHLNDNVLISLVETVYNTKNKHTHTQGDKDGYTTLVEYAGGIYEEILKDGKACFLSYNGMDAVEYHDEITINDTHYQPITGEAIDKGAVLLSDGIEEYGTTEALLKEIEQVINAYVDAPEAYIKYASYYVLLTWISDRLSTIPYLRALGDMGTGKSRLGDVVGALCWRKLTVAGAITPAPLYRLLELWKGTLVIDEGDLKNSDEYSEVIKILNCGFERGRPVIRCNKDNPRDLQFFDAFGPKIIATRKGFKDPALESRCLTQVMKETQRKDIPPILPKEFYEQTKLLRRRLMKWRIDNRLKINPEAGVKIPFDGLEPRMRQVASSYAVLFASEPAILNDFLGFMKERQRELIEERASTQDGAIVNAIYEIKNEEPLVEREISSRGIEDHLKQDGIEITHRVIGKHLRNLGIETKFIYKSKNKTGKRHILWDKEHMETLFRRYVIDEWNKTISSLSSLSSLSRGVHDHPLDNNQQMLNTVKDASMDDEVTGQSSHDIHDIYDIYDIKKEERVSQFDIVNSVLEAIRELEREYGSARLGEIAKALGIKMGVNDEYVRLIDVLALLKRDGIVFEPSPQAFKVV